MPNLPNPDIDARAVGPGAIEESNVDVKPLLDGASEYEYVEILNILPVTFIAKFAVTRPVRGEVRIVTSKDTPTITESEADIRRNYGLDLRNKDHQGKMNIVQKVTIAPGATIRVLGNEAQVIVNQMVTEILQRRGLKLHLADPTQRNIVEQEIVRRRDSVESILGRSPVSVQDQLQAAIAPQQEVEFPDVTIGRINERLISQSTPDNADTGKIGGGETYIPKRSVGRPPKAQAAA